VNTFHDYTIERFDWHIESRVLGLEFATPAKYGTCRAEFLGVLGWHIDDAVNGCIVSSLIEIKAHEYLAEDEDYIQSRLHECYTVAVDAVRQGNGRVWRIESSYGLSGYIIAEDLRELD